MRILDYSLDLQPSEAETAGALATEEAGASQARSMGPWQHDDHGVVIDGVEVEARSALCPGLGKVS